MDGCYLSTEGIKPLKGLIYRFALDKRISVIDWLIIDVDILLSGMQQAKRDEQAFSQMAEGLYVLMLKPVD